MLHAAFAWIHNTQNPNFIEKLRSLTRSAMNLYASFPRSTPTRTVEFISDTVPTHLYGLKEGMCSYVMLKPSLNLGWVGTNDHVTQNVSHLKYLIFGIW